MSPWQKMHESFQLTLEMLKEDCQATWPGDFEELTAQANTPQAKEEDDARRKRQTEHPLVAASNRYMTRRNGLVKRSMSRPLATTMHGWKACCNGWPAPMCRLMRTIGTMQSR